MKLIFENLIVKKKLLFQILWFNSFCLGSEIFILLRSNYDKIVAFYIMLKIHSQVFKENLSHKFTHGVQNWL